MRACPWCGPEQGSGDVRPCDDGDGISRPKELDCWLLQLGPPQLRAPGRGGSGAEKAVPVATRRDRKFQACEKTCPGAGLSRESVMSAPATTASLSSHNWTHPSCRAPGHGGRGWRRQSLWPDGVTGSSGEHARKDACPGAGLTEQGSGIVRPCDAGDGIQTRGTGAHRRINTVVSSALELACVAGSGVCSPLRVSFGDPRKDLSVQGGALVVIEGKTCYHGIAPPA